MSSVSQILKHLNRTDVLDEMSNELKTRLDAIETTIHMSQKECTHDIVCILGKHSSIDPYISPSNEANTYCPLCGKSKIKLHRCKEGMITVLDISQLPMETDKERMNTFVSVLKEVCEKLELKKGSKQINAIILPLKSKCRENNWPLKIYKATL